MRDVTAIDMALNCSARTLVIGGVAAHFLAIGLYALPSR
jgi:hypothetical protein